MWPACAPEELLPQNASSTHHCLSGIDGDRTESEVKVDKPQEHHGTTLAVSAWTWQGISLSPIVLLS